LIVLITNNHFCLLLLSFWTSQKGAAGLPVILIFVPKHKRIAANQNTILTQCKHQIKTDNKLFRSL
jgi:hypothetical protein